MLWKNGVLNHMYDKDLILFIKAGISISVKQKKSQNDIFWNMALFS
jgi:hypothetical protein